MSTLGKLRRFQRLSVAQRRICGQAALLIPLVRVGLRLCGLDAISHALNLSKTAKVLRVPSHEQTLEARAITAAIELTARHVPGGTHCLTRSLVLMTLLKKRAIDVHLRIGVTLPSNFRAHAWIELPDGEVLNDRAANIEPFERMRQL